MKKVFRLYIIFILSLSSCFKKENLNDAIIFEDRVFESLITTYNISFADASIVNSNQIISAPAGLWLLIAEFISFSDRFQNDQTLCVFYRVPMVDLGELLITKNKAGKCLGHIGSDDKKIATLRDINGLKVSFKDDKDNFFSIFSLSFFKSGKSKEVQFILGNINRDKNNLLTIMPSVNFYKKSDKNYKMMGELQDNYKEKTAIACHKVNKECSTTLDFKCDKCRYGWYEVVNVSCPQGGDKYCGQENCGEKGSPACARGFSYIKQKFKNVCFNDSPFGFCNQGLSPVCDDNSVLICM